MAIIASGYCLGHSPAEPIAPFNNGLPGDSFNNPSASNAGQAVGGRGFYSNNVCGNGVAGISSASARSGNGPVFFNSADGASKADFKLLPHAVFFTGNSLTNPEASLRRPGGLAALAHKWCRESASLCRPVLVGAV